ncbi:MAG TPA: hypothetical protein VKX40_10065 [Aequorivita sp.]|nr:hypothetical protein [Aequorivita sp.]
MKHAEKHIVSLLIALVTFLAFGNSSFANAIEFEPSKAEIVSIDFQDQDQGRPFVFNEISIGKASSTVSQQETSSVGLFLIQPSNENASFAGVSKLYNSSFFLNDHRKSLFRYLFPFHTFW